MDLSESFQPNSYPLLLCENFGSHAGTPELSLEQMLPLGEAVVLVERGHLLLPGCQPPSFLRVRGCLPSRQAVGSQSPPGSCRAGGGSPDFPQGAAAHKHSLASLWKLPECLPLSPHSGPRRPVWPSEEGCPPHPELFVGGARKAKATGFGAQEKATVIGQREGCLPAAFI